MTKIPQYCANPNSSPTSTIELSVCCYNLANMDYMSKSDPICVLFVKNVQPVSHAETQIQWIEYGRSEEMKDDLNPRWETKFLIDYAFEQKQLLKFEVYDVDDESGKLTNQDFLGKMECTLGQIVSSAGGRFVAPLQNSPYDLNSTITVIGEELSTNKEELTFQITGMSLLKKTWFSKSNPFYEISKSSKPSNNTFRDSGSGLDNERGRDESNFVVVYRSEIISNDLNAAWKSKTISVSNLCNNDHSRPLKIEVYHQNSSNKQNISIGCCLTSLSHLMVCCAERIKLSLQSPSSPWKQIKASERGCGFGTIQVVKCNVVRKFTFLDYIQSGTTQLNFSIAIDFTASNGHPNDPESLHHIIPNSSGSESDNQYTLAIKSVGSIIEDYDSDKMFPALGFGARIPPKFVVSDEFFLNLQSNQPFCSGVDGVLTAYLDCLSQVQLYGPTNFSPVIRHVKQFARCYGQHHSIGSNYFILMIITDGIITDMDDTIDEIVDASTLPFSLIIVGVGNEDFSTMQILDGDQSPLRDRNGTFASRDIVQFVQLNNFLYAGGGWDHVLLAKSVLEELPDQVTSWLKSKNILPKQDL